jgi:hypothetical protein
MKKYIFEGRESQFRRRKKISLFGINSYLGLYYQQLS